MFLQQKIHFIGIGGIGMSAIAKILFQKGFKISGSDQNENLIVKDLKKKGVKVFKYLVYWFRVRLGMMNRKFWRPSSNFYRRRILMC